MGELIELSYRRFPRLIIETLVRSGYLLRSERHKPGAVVCAWNCLKQDSARDRAQADALMMQTDAKPQAS
jgi:hypothetical protein